MCWLTSLARGLVLHAPAGYKAYIGMLLVEHTHNNPTLRTFCQLLLDTQRHKRRRSFDESHDAQYLQLSYRQPVVYVNDTFDKGLRVDGDDNNITLVSMETLKAKATAAAAAAATAAADDDDDEINHHQHHDQHDKRIRVNVEINDDNQLEVKLPSPVKFNGEN